MRHPARGTPIPVMPPKVTQTAKAGHKLAAGLMSGGQPPHCTGERASVSEGLTERNEFKITLSDKSKRNRSSRQQQN